MTTRAGSPSGSAPKRARTTNPSLALPNAPELAKRYQTAAPYKHVVVDGLIDDTLLESVVEESRTYGNRGEDGSLAGWGWEQKETDIYKIQQTPDLSSLDPEHLPEDTLAALPQLTKLKDALYSPEFREFVRDVTNCGPLSGRKVDGSVALYSQGSHLLLHDDSISTRVISYILYLPNSPSAAADAKPSFEKGWKPEWGGSLELYPVESGEDVGLPGVKKLASVDVKWGRLVFFEVQPGRSYHSVEEVVVGDGRQRLGVSGWFHRPIEGEVGYEPISDKERNKSLSSLAQITSAPTLALSVYPSDPPAGLTASHLKALQPFLSPAYLSAETLERLSQQFVAASEIVMHNFLRPDVAEKLKAETKAADAVYGPCIPSQDCGEGSGWEIKGPTSKHRYASLQGESTSTPTMQSLLKDLLPTEAFRAWLAVVSSLVPTGYRAEARRFRKGLDYTLASGEESSGEARLDCVLGATWWADAVTDEDEDQKLLENGGWECYISPPDADDDPTVYNSKGKAAANSDDQEKSEAEAEAGAGADPNEPALEASNGVPSISYGGVDLEVDPDQFSPSDFDSDSDDGDDGPLLTQGVAFNKLLLVLRDPGVMKFVKYLSNSAPGSRWDVGGEWEVAVLEEEDGEEAVEASEATS